MIAASAFIFLLVGWRFQGIQPLLLEVSTNKYLQDVNR